jgi:hypothetical protein
MWSRSSNLPTTAGVVQQSYGGGISDSYLGILNEDGSLHAATYLGGSGMERAPYGLEVAANGDVVVGTATQSSDIPTSAGAFRSSIQLPPSRPTDGFVCRISGDLRALRWCTYTGGGWPRGGLALDRAGAVTVVGDATHDANFPLTPGALQTVARGESDAFILKLNSNGTSAVYSTRLGGSGSLFGEIAMSVRLLPGGDVSVMGTSASNDFPTTPGAAFPTSPGPRDLYIARLNESGSSLVYSTYLGGSGTELGEHRHWLMSDGSVLVAGFTMSSDIPGALGGLRGPSDGLVARLNPSGSAFDFIAYLGGSGDELLLGPVVDREGNIYAFGHTSSRDIPTTADAIQPNYGGGERDGVLFILSPAGAIRYATYLGGSSGDLIRGIAIGSSGEIYLGGATESDDFPITPGALQTSIGGQQDGFLAKLVPVSG